MRHQRYFKLAGCPRCKDILKISFSMFGKPFNCPKCGKALKLISRKEKKKNDVEAPIKSLPEKRKKIVLIMDIVLHPIRKIIDGIRYVSRVCSNKDS